MYEIEQCPKRTLPKFASKLISNIESLDRFIDIMISEGEYLKFEMRWKVHFDNDDEDDSENDENDSENDEEP
jgi:hypothetical protein